MVSTRPWKLSCKQAGLEKKIEQRNLPVAKKYLKDNNHNNLHLARKYAQIFFLGHHLFREANSFPRASLLSTEIV